MKKIGKLGILLIFLALVIIGYYVYQFEIDKISTDTKEDTINKSENSTLTDSTTLDSMIEIVTNGCYVGEEGEKVEQDGYDVTVNQVTITKQEGDWEDDIGLIESIDESGLILSDQYFVVINVTIEKVADSYVDFCLGNLWLGFFTENEMAYGAIELDAVGGLYSNNDPDAYFIELEEGKTYNYDLIYVLDREYISDDIHFLFDINFQGQILTYADPEDYSMIFLKSMEDISDEY